MDLVFNPTQEVVWYAKNNTAAAQYMAPTHFPDYKLLGRRAQSWEQG